MSLSFEQVLELVQTGASVVISDAEYLNETLGKPERPGPQHWKEVVQIGAVRYENGVKVATFDRLVYPTIYGNKIDDDQWLFFEKLTGLKRETIMKDGEDFEQVWSDFVNFSNGAPIIVILGDREVYKWNFRLLDKEQDATIQDMPWIILQPLLPPHLKTKSNGKNYLSGELYQHVNLKEEDVLPGSTTHNALFDATSMGLFLAQYKQ